MKLYYAPGACSLAPHIALREAGLDFEPIKTDLRAKTLPDGSDYFAVNPQGAVPALGLDNGEVLTQNVAIMDYISDQVPAKHMIPEDGMAHYRVMELLSYITSEVHKSYAPLWNPTSSEEAKTAARELIAKKYDYLATRLGDGPYLTGEAFTPADAYLFVMLNWAGMKDVDLSRVPTLVAFHKRVGERPAVQAAMRAEGLIQ